MNESKIIGVLLAGGESRRFGSPKAFARLQNKHFYEYAIDALIRNVNQLYIVSHPSIKEQFRSSASIQVIQDIPIYQGSGPLAGIFTVMQKTNSEWYVILPCDTPFVTDILVKQLISFTNDESIDAIVPIINDRQQPLIAVYHARVAKKIEQLLIEKKFKMSQLLGTCNVKFVTNQDLHFQGREFENINNKAEFEKLKQKPM